MITWIKALGLNLTSSEAHTKGGTQSSTNRALDYFSQLTRDQVEELYSIYRLDFMLFSYKPDMFIKVANNDTLRWNLLERAKQEQISKMDTLNERIC